MRRGLLLVLTAVCAFVLVFASAASAQDGDRAALLKDHFQKAVKAFENGLYDQAAAEFEEVMKLSPNSADALDLREMAGVQFYVQVMTKGTAESRARVMRLLELAAEAEKQRLTDKDQITKLVGRLGGTFEDRAEAYVQLTGAGRYAVPPLVEKLANTKAPDYPEARVYATIALIRVGEEAVLPLCTALRASSAALRQDICFILGRIGDPRAGAYLLREAKSDPEESVRPVAADALARIRQYAVIPDEAPAPALFKLARLYYYSDPSVYRPGKFGETVWAWSDADNRLVIQAVPSFVGNIATSRSILVEAMLADPNYEPVLPLLISAYHKEALLIQRRLELSQTDPQAKLAEPEEQALRARLAACQNALLTLRSSGERHFYRALTLELHDRNPDLAAAVIEDLALVASPMLASCSDVPDLYSPLSPAVVIVDRLSTGSEEAAETETTSAAESAAGGVRIDPARLFGSAVRAEQKRVEAAAPAPKPAARTVAGATPAERETLYQLVATAHRRAAESRAGAETGKSEVRAESGAEALNPLVLALASPDKIVRYSAAAALVRLRPVRDFSGSRAVVDIIGQALTEKGSSAVLVVSSDSQAANSVAATLREVGYLLYTAASTESALSAARALPPKDVILLAEDLNDTFTALKKDPAVAGIPVVVFTKDADTSAAKQTYGDKAAAVVSLKDGADRLKGAVAGVVLGQRTANEAQRLTTEYARIGARALAAIPAAGSPFSPHLVRIKDSLLAAIDGQDPEVRVAAIESLGKAGIKSLLPRLVDIYEGKDRAPAEQLACISAIGLLLEPGQPTPPEVIALLQKIHQTGSLELRLYAVRHLAPATLTPADLEKLLTAQEGAPPAPPAPRVPPAAP